MWLCAAFYCPARTTHNGVHNDSCTLAHTTVINRVQPKTTSPRLHAVRIRDGRSRSVTDCVPGSVPCFRHGILWGVGSGGGGAVSGPTEPAWERGRVAGSERSDGYRRTATASSGASLRDRRPITASNSTRPMAHSTMLVETTRMFLSVRMEGRSATRSGRGARDQNGQDTCRTDQDHPPRSGRSWSSEESPDSGNQLEGH